MRDSLSLVTGERNLIFRRLMPGETYIVRNSPSTTSSGLPARLGL